MPRIPRKKTRRFRIIEDGVSVGMSGKRIAKLLREQGLGVRNKKLYEEIRAIKKVTISSEKREKSVPKKYRKKSEKQQKTELAKMKWEKKAGKLRQLYRGSLIISSVPLHSTPFNRNYIGFRLNIFSFDKKTVYDTMRSMKKTFLRMVGNYLKSQIYASEQVMGTENPIRIYLNNPEEYDNKWFFAVESKGRDVYSESGNI